MPPLINSAPDCVVSREGAEPADDSLDFILQANYEDCAGFGTFMPGSTYGEEGSCGGDRLLHPHLAGDRGDGSRPDRVGGL